MPSKRKLSLSGSGPFQHRSRRHRDWDRAQVTHLLPVCITVYATVQQKTKLAMEGPRASCSSLWRWWFQHGGREQQILWLPSLQVALAELTSGSPQAPHPHSVARREPGTG